MRFMKYSLRKITIISVLFIMIIQLTSGGFAFADTVSPSLIIPDANLVSAIRTVINKPVGDLTSTDVERITYLPAENMNISSIEGIQNLTNLRDLRLAKNQISDISPVAGLTNLVYLVLNNNKNYRYKRGSKSHQFGRFVALRKPYF